MPITITHWKIISQVRGPIPTPYLRIAPKVTPRRR